MLCDSFSSDKDDDIYINVKDARNPNEFIACLGTISDFSKFEFFLKKLNDWCKENEIKSPLNRNDLYIEQLVLVKYKVDESDDIVWKRGKIIELEDTTVEVLLIDEGVFLKIPFNEININMPDFTNDFAGQAKMCSLNKAIPVSNTWTEEDVTFFKEKINDNGLAVTYVNKRPYKDLKNAFNQEYIIDVFYINDNKKILDVLVQKNHAKVLSFSSYRDSSMNEKIVEEIQLSSGEENDVEEEIEDEIDEILYVESVKMEQSMSKNSLANSKAINYDSENVDDDDIIECFNVDCNSSMTSKNDKTNIRTQKASIGLAKSNKKSHYDLNRSRTGNATNGHDVSTLVDYFEEESNIPLLTSHDYFCSDDTIQTGYRPNVNINSAGISRQIKKTNLKILQKTVYGDKNIISKAIPDEDINLKNTEKRIFEVVSGTSGLYNSLDKKYNAIAKIYMDNPRINLMIILKCILREIKNKKTKIEDGFDLMKSKYYFHSAFDEIVADNEPTEVDQEMVAIGDSKRQSFCYYLADVYKLALNTDKFPFLKLVPSKCNDIIKSWIGSQNTQTLCSVRHAKLKCVYDFLSKCLEDFKLHHFDTFDRVLDKALEHANDFNILPREIVTASNKIVELYARAYRNSRAQSKTSSHTLHDQASTVRNGDHNSDYICFSRKRKSTSPSFIDYFRINNDEDSF